MTASVQTLIEEFKAVVFEKDELQNRDTSQLKSILPLLVKQESISDVTKKQYNS